MGNDLKNLQHLVEQMTVLRRRADPRFQLTTRESMDNRAKLNRLWAGAEYEEDFLHCTARPQAPGEGFIPICAGR